MNKRNLLIRAIRLAVKARDMQTRLDKWFFYNNKIHTFTNMLNKLNKQGSHYE
jgi:hypothetical protein